MVMMARQHGQVAPVRDIVPAPIRLSYSRRLRRVASALRDVGLDSKDDSRLRDVGLDRQHNALEVFPAQPAGLSNGTMARHCLQTTVRACR